MRQGLLHQGLLRDDAGFTVNFAGGTRLCARSRRRGGAGNSRERFNGLGVRVLPGRVPFHRSAHRRRGRLRRESAALHRRDRLLAGAAGDSRSRRCAISDHRDDIRSRRFARVTSSSSERSRSVSNWRRPLPGSALRSPCSKPATPLQEPTRSARRSCSTRWRAMASPCAPGSRLRACAVRGRYRRRYRGRWRRKTQTIEGSHILVAAGQRPNVEALGLDAAGIRHDAERHRGRSGAPHQQPASLCHRRRYRRGGPQPSRAPSSRTCRAQRLVPHPRDERQQCGAPRHLYRSGIGPGRPDRRSGAGGRSAAFASCARAYGENDRARASGTTAGHVKIVTNRKGAILGATIVGAGAAETIAAWTLAILAKPEYRGHGRCYRAVSELCRGRQTGRDDLFHTWFDEPAGAAHHSLAASVWLISASGNSMARHDG